MTASELLVMKKDPSRIRKTVQELEPVSWVWESVLNGKSPFKDLVLFGNTFSSGKDATRFLLSMSLHLGSAKIRTKHWAWICKQTITIHL